MLNKSINLFKIKHSSENLVSPGPQVNQATRKSPDAHYDQSVPAY